MKNYQIQDKEAGNVIEAYLTHEQAIKTLKKYEERDRIDNDFTPDFYEIVEMDDMLKTEINKLQKVEAISEKILAKLESMVDIDPCGLERCHLINAIQRIISQETNLKKA
jgi:hypothetical protein